MLQRAIELLSQLIAAPSVNPMGQTPDPPAPAERAVIELVERELAPFHVQTQRQPVGPAHENLLVTVPGKIDGPRTLFEAHADTVPADDWPDRAFSPRVEGSLVFGRGACDDKGSLAAMLLAVQSLLESGRRPPQPVLILVASDEEYGQAGIRYFVEHCGVPIGRAVFGEPTGVVPVVRHKGLVRWDITTHGSSAHSSMPQLGRNAILDMTKVIDALTAHQRTLDERFHVELLDPPTLTVTMIRGGRTRNAVPDQCTIAVDLRVLPGMDLQAARDEVIGIVDALPVEATHSDNQATMRPLDTRPTDPFAQAILALCSEQLGRPLTVKGEPYGTDAAWAPPGVPALVLGPGSGESAHAIDEHIDAREIVQCTEVYRQIMLRDWSQEGPGDAVAGSQRPPR